MERFLEMNLNPFGKDIFVVVKMMVDFEIIDFFKQILLYSYNKFFIILILFIIIIYLIIFMLYIYVIYFVLV